MNNNFKIGDLVFIKGYNRPALIWKLTKTQAHLHCTEAKPISFIKINLEELEKAL